MHDDERSVPAAPERDRTEVITVVMLSVVAVLTAWCGFEASKWGGEMSIAFSTASSARIQAAAAEGEARDHQVFDLTIYASYVEAVAAGDTKLAGYIEDRFTPEFATAFDAWTADGRVEPSPFAREEYSPPGTVEAEQLAERADEQFDAALENNARGDRYSLLTVLFALVLFLVAISQRAATEWGTRMMLGLGIVLAIVGAGILATFPVKI